MLDVLLTLAQQAPAVSPPPMPTSLSEFWPWALVVGIPALLGGSYATFKGASSAAARVATWFTSRVAEPLVAAGTSYLKTQEDTVIALKNGVTGLHAKIDVVAADVAEIKKRPTCHPHTHGEKP
jgi:hypothetical protein